MTSDAEWYAERDHRSNLVRTWDASLSPVVAIEAALAATREGEIAAEVLVNTMARFMRSGTLVLPDGPSALHEHKSVHASLHEIATRADPRFRLRTSVTSPSGSSTWVTVGDCGDGSVDRYLPALGAVQIVPPAARPTLPERADAMGAILAGCLAARGVFARAAGMTDLSARTPLTFTAMRSRLTRLDLGRVHLVGAGGVGSNLAYYLPMLGVSGHLSVIDHDHVTASNLNRCLPFWDAHARAQAKKAIVVANHLRESGIRTEPHVMTYGEYVKTNGRGSPRMIIMLANDLEVWNTIQNNYPPLTFSAATSASWGIHTARHEPVKDACVACLLGMHDHTNAPLACDAAQTLQPEKKELGVLPFFAPLAAALLLAHILDTVNGVTPAANMRMTNVGVPHPRLDETRLGKRRQCVCATQDPDLHRTILEKASTATTAPGRPRDHGR